MKRWQPWFLIFAAALSYAMTVGPDRLQTRTAEQRALDDHEILVSVQVGERANAYALDLLIAQDPIQDRFAGVPLLVAGAPDGPVYSLGDSSELGTISPAPPAILPLSTAARSRGQ